MGCSLSSQARTPGCTADDIAAARRLRVAQVNTRRRANSRPPRGYEAAQRQLQRELHNNNNNPDAVEGYRGNLLSGAARPTNNISIHGGVCEHSKRLFALRQLPREAYTHAHHKDLLECELCLEDYEEDDKLLRLPCMHVFHERCIAPWIEKAGTCPDCQTDVCKAIGLR
eukprot:TRINITY_DN7203_c0_g1_i3.p2 TRINITY_DN7203_c0_g1~~TRINITY_DN7203_c0_g1_i3.p2  ORF type:complete len:170 (+),score=28.74 TRINITY_DN7203_c0_g1_i3:81-590(+)